MFTGKDLRKLLIPLIIEQVLTSLMGTADTLMVANIGSDAVSGVSCVDSINKLVLFLFTSVATGGCIICSQFLGRNDRKEANETARQVLITSTFISVVIMLLCLMLRKILLNLVFGSVEPDVMKAAQIYFLITIISYPFTAVFNACGAIMRAAGNSRVPMLVSVFGNFLNIIGNYILLFVVKIGVTGAALSTTVSMAVIAVIMVILIERRDETDKNNCPTIEIGNLLKLRPNMRLIGKILKIGIPTGVENTMFQFGKLVVQSTVATLGTVAIASNAIVTSLELFTSMPSQGIGIGLMTVAGQCIGAGLWDEARQNIRKLTFWAAAVMLVVNWAVYFLTVPVCDLAGFDRESTALSLSVMLAISIVKPVLWPLAFVPSNGMRAAGDVNYTMIVSVFSMWIFRVGLTTILCRVLGIGLIGIWCGYFADWTVRSIACMIRYRSGKWMKHSIID